VRGQGGSTTARRGAGGAQPLFGANGPVRSGRRQFPSVRAADCCGGAFSDGPPSSSRPPCQPSGKSRRHKPPARHLGEFLAVLLGGATWLWLSVSREAARLAQQAAMGRGRRVEVGDLCLMRGVGVPLRARAATSSFSVRAAVARGAARLFSPPTQRLLRMVGGRVKVTGSFQHRPISLEIHEKTRPVLVELAAQLHS